MPFDPNKNSVISYLCYNFARQSETSLIMQMKVLRTRFEKELVIFLLWILRVVYNDLQPNCNYWDSSFSFGSPRLKSQSISIMTVQNKFKQLFLIFTTLTITAYSKTTSGCWFIIDLQCIGLSGCALVALFLL